MRIKKNVTTMLVMSAFILGAFAFAHSTVESMHMKPSTFTQKLRSNYLKVIF